MGNKGSKTKESDDGCIGNRKVRTVVLSLVLIAFFVFGLAYFEANRSFYADLDDTVNGIPFIGDTCDYCEGMSNAWLLIMIGAITCIIGAIAALVLFLLPGCDDKMGTTFSSYCISSDFVSRSISS